MSTSLDAPFALIIGGGPAGIEAACLLAEQGKEVVLVSQEPPGGRALWHSLIPSKVWLSLAEWLELQTLWQGRGERSFSLAEVPALVRRRLPAVKEALHRQHQHRLARAGVRIVPGKATFQDARQVLVESKEGQRLTIRPRYVLLATGSVPIFLPGVAPDGQRILAPRAMSSLSRLPSSLVMIGCGATGCEYAYLFQRLGVQVTAVTDQPQILPRFGAAIASRLEAYLVELGVRLMKNSPVQSVESDAGGVQVHLQDGNRISAEAAFLAMGRRPDVQALHLEAAGLGERPEQGISVNRECRTAMEHIFAAGDVVGVPMLANRAKMQARVAALNMLVPGSATFRPEQVIEAVYTHPPVARVGLTQQDAEERFPHDLDWREVPYSLAEKAFLTDAQRGLLRILFQKSTGRLLAAEAIGEQAPELLAPISLLLRKEGTLEELAAVAPANPTLFELYLHVARPRLD